MERSRQTSKREATSKLVKPIFAIPSARLSLLRCTARRSPFAFFCVLFECPTTHAHESITYSTKHTRIDLEFEHDRERELLEVRLRAAASLAYTYSAAGIERSRA